MRIVYGTGSLSPFVFIFLLLYMTPENGKTQSSATDPYYHCKIQPGIFMSGISVVDKKFSSSTFKGLLPGIGLNLGFENTGSLHELNLQYSWGTLKNQGDHFQLKHAVATIDYANLYPVFASHTGSITYSAGGTFQILYSERTFKDFINYDQSFDMMVAVGPVLQAAYDFGTNKSLLLSDRFSFPLLFLYAQSPFAYNEKSGVDFFIDNARLASLSECLRMGNQLLLTKKLGARQSAGISYNWSFYRIKSAREVSQANHQFLISYQYKW